MARQYSGGKRATVTADQLDKYRAVLRSVQERAGVPIEQLFNALDLGAAASEAALVEAIALQVDIYGGAMAEAVSAFLEQQLIAAGDVAAAEAIKAATGDALASAQAVDKAPIADRVAYNAHQAQTTPEAKEAAAKLMNEDTQRRVKQRGYDLADEAIERSNETLKSQGRAPVEYWFAWVPSSATPCAFCVAVASNSWRRANKKNIRSYAKELHGGCSCELIIRTSTADIAGYDPDKYLTDYLDAAKAADVKGGRATINALRRQQYADPAIGDRIRAQHRAQYARQHPKDEQTD